MLYWCREYFHGFGLHRQIIHIYGGSGFAVGRGWNDEFSPAMLVTGVKLEEVVLNAVLV